MTKRHFLAGVLGGVAMYAWASIAHVVLPLGMIGVQEIPNEPPVLAAMHSSIGGGNGLYVFPAMGGASMQQYAQKVAANPHGLLVYNPPGGEPLSPGQLVTEFLAEIVETLIAVYLLAQTRLSGFGARLGFVTLAGFLAHLPANVSYWNWYGFPTTYTVSYIAIGVVGFFCAGLVVAAMLKRHEA